MSTANQELSPVFPRVLCGKDFAGRPIGAMDAFLAATAGTRQLTLVTRNVSDFPLLKAVLDPWT
jgi:toxin FitB